MQQEGRKQHLQSHNAPVAVRQPSQAATPGSMEARGKARSTGVIIAFLLASFGTMVCLRLLFTQLLGEESVVTSEWQKSFSTKKICHLHVPKTGGTSLSQYLYSHTKLRACCPHPGYCTKFHSRSDIQRFLINPDCEFVSGEWNLSFVHSLPGYMELVTFARKPSSHVLSMIFHFMNSRYNTVQEKLDAQLAMERNKNRGSPHGYNLRNSQASRLLPRLNMSLTEIPFFLQKTYFFIGITDYYWHSLCALDFLLGIFNTTSCDCDVQNSMKEGIPHANNAARHTDKYKYNYTLDQLSLVLSMTDLDEVIYSASLLRLISLLGEVEEKKGVTLLSCLVSQPQQPLHRAYS